MAKSSSIDSTDRGGSLLRMDMVLAWRGNQVVGLSTKRRPEAAVAWTSPAPTDARTFEMVASGMRLNAVESASAAVAVGIAAVTLRYRAAQPPEFGSNRWLKRPS